MNYWSLVFIKFQAVNGAFNDKYMYNPKVVQLYLMLSYLAVHIVGLYVSTYTVVFIVTFV